MIALFLLVKNHKNYTQKHEFLTSFKILNNPLLTLPVYNCLEVGHPPLNAVIPHALILFDITHVNHLTLYICHLQNPSE